MPILMQADAAIHYPVIICDQCAKPISEAENGVFQFRKKRTSSQKLSVQYFLHKKCSLKHHQRMETVPGDWHCDEIANFLFRLVDHTKTDVDAARAAHEEKVESVGGRLPRWG